MEVIDGSARFGLWYVHIRWSDTTIYRVRFSRFPEAGPVPAPIARYLSGREVDLSGFTCGVSPPGEPYARIYREVQQIPYGETSTYSEIAERAGTHARVVGQALSRNLLPLIIPCHRVVSRSGIGGFTPDPTIKEDLLAMERRSKRRRRKKTETGDES
ncbi:MAG: methylated-DNA--[protein]-cysteine S-methyltransferase [Methanoregulaceae archaeon]|nr:methylated-DNA--[protein]-cysteine S-methyltransferase [Methanoregulaceae archaeon]